MKSQIQMEETRRGSDDGFTTRQFHKSCIYTIGEDIGHTLACSFINKGWAMCLETSGYSERFSEFVADIKRLREMRNI